MTLNATGEEGQGHVQLFWSGNHYEPLEAIAEEEGDGAADARRPPQRRSWVLCCRFAPG